MTDSQTLAPAQWPAVRAEAVAELVSALSPRLQKRLDGAAAKLADRPAVRSSVRAEDGTGDGTGDSARDEWRIQVDEEVVLVLHAPDGVIRTAADVRCSCLLAPACLHRAAVVTAAPLAAADTDLAEPGPAAEPDGDGAGPGTTASTGAPPGPDTPPTGTAKPDEAAATPTPATGERPGEDPGDRLTPAETEAVQRLRRSAAAALAAGVSGAGGVPQAELLRTAYQARLLGLHRPAVLAATVVTRLRAARAGEPDHRLADLATAYRELLAVTTIGTGGELRGTARQTYQEAGSLRLYGLFAEPLVSATHAGVTVWTVDADGRLSTVSDITPHSDPVEAAQLAQAAATRSVRLGDATLSHRELARAGLVVQGATRTVSGRLGAGAKVRAVRAAGADWHQPPVAGLWQQPPAVQAERALAAERTPYELRPAGTGLLFLDVTLLGPGAVPGFTTPQLLADCAGLTVALLPAQDHPKLAFRSNLALLAAAPGLRLRVIGRLERAAHPRIRLLAVGTARGEDAPTLGLSNERQHRVSLGLERLQRADLPPDADAERPTPSQALEASQPPVHLLTRRLEQVVTSGRRALTANLTQGAAEARLLREAGLGTGEQLLAGLRSAAAEQERDVFGRLRADDHVGFALSWLAAACYQEELATALCAAAWQGRPAG
ncbi:hypothetical protein [Kitasatospora sp. NPDC001175]|uniref:hypothetical protein n=1 Tax=Kitasatospora sp. NPDC001175 TaxID=3157103 RepID=UPI003D02C72D